jgi:hypothetical protein
MKYKFHEPKPSYEIASDGRQWPEQACDNTKLFIKELNWIAKNTGKDFNKLRVDDMTFGEPVVFYSDKYMGYLDSIFYRCFDTDSWDEYWDYDN